MAEDIMVDGNQLWEAYGDLQKEYSTARKAIDTYRERIKNLEIFLGRSREDTAALRARIAELEGALKACADSAWNHSESFYEDARQYSVEGEREAEKRCMRMAAAWEKQQGLALSALTPKPEQQG